MDYNNLGNSGDYDYTILKTTPNTAFRGTLDGAMGTQGGQYGQQVGAKFSDATLVDGVLMEKVGSGVLKLFGWPMLAKDANTDVPESDWSVEDAPERYVETHPGGQSEYELVKAVLSLDDPLGDTDDLFELGNVIVFESGSTKPSSSAKMTVYSLGSRNGDEILSTDTVFGWIDTSMTLRPSLEGRDVLYAKIEEPVPDNDRGQTFHKPIFIDAVSGQNIIKGIRFNGDEAFIPESQTAEATAATDGGAAVAETTPSPSAPAPSAVDSFIGTMVDLQVSDLNMIASQVDTLTASGGHDLTQEDVDEFGGVGEIASAIRARIDG